MPKPSMSSTASTSILFCVWTSPWIGSRNRPVRNPTPELRSRLDRSRDSHIPTAPARRGLDAGATNGEIARKYQLSPHLLERWRGEWRARGDLAFPGIGRRGAALAAVDDARRIT